MANLRKACHFKGCLSPLMSLPLYCSFPIWFRFAQNESTIPYMYIIHVVK